MVLTTKLLWEIFDEFEKREKREDKIAVLRFNQTYALKNVLKGTYDPNIKFAITKVPYYQPSDAPDGMGYTTIHNEISRAYVFEEGNPKVNPDLTLARKEIILTQILEALEKREAEIFMNMLLKKQKVKGLNAGIVKEAFPDLF
jgi:hypothetical protein